jgi:hypothetical protein
MRQMSRGEGGRDEGVLQDVESAQTKRTYLWRPMKQQLDILLRQPISHSNHRNLIIARQTAAGSRMAARFVPVLGGRARRRRSFLVVGGVVMAIFGR